MDLNKTTSWADVEDEGQAKEEPVQTGDELHVLANEVLLLQQEGALHVQMPMKQE